MAKAEIPFPLYAELLHTPVSKYITTYIVISADGYAACCDELNIDPRDRGDWLHVNANAQVHHFDVKLPVGRAAVVAFDPREYKGWKPARFYGFMVHEMLHVWQEYLEVIGEDSPGREIEAHAVQELFSSAATAYDELQTEHRYRVKEARCRAKATSSPFAEGVTSI